MLVNKSSQGGARVFLRMVQKKLFSETFRIYERSCFNLNLCGWTANDDSKLLSHYLLARYSWLGGKNPRFFFGGRTCFLFIGVLSRPTCVGERWMRLARCSRSGAERYFCCLNRRSSSYTCKCHDLSTICQMLIISEYICGYSIVVICTAKTNQGASQYKVLWFCWTKQLRLILCYFLATKPPANPEQLIEDCHKHYWLGLSNLTFTRDCF